MVQLAVGLLIVFAALPPQVVGDDPAWQARVNNLIRQLGDASFAKREAATKTLLEEGERIVPLLDRARPGADLELARRIDWVRHQLVGFMDDLNALLKTLEWKENAPPPDIHQPAVPLVHSAQPRSGDYLLKIIADPSHVHHRAASNLFCSTWQTGSADQLRKYLDLSLQLHALHRPQYPQGVEAMIEARYWQRLGPNGWPKLTGWKATTTVYVDDSVHGKPSVSTHDGGAVTAGWINTAKLRIGTHRFRFSVAYEFTHKGARHTGNLRSREFVFEVQPDTGDALLAKTDRALEERIHHDVLIMEHSHVFRTGAIERFPGDALDLWQPQVTWQDGNKRSGLHIPEWSVQKPLPVDLCFEVEMRDLKTDKRYPCHPLVLYKGKAGRGYFAPDDARAFAAGREGFVDIELRLKPSRNLALSDPGVTSYFGGEITSIPLQAKIISDYQPARPRQFQLR